MAIFTSADSHFGHKNILRYCHRPFLSIEEHDNTIIDNINNVVGPNDVLYHLGDFSFRGGSPSQYRSRINCRNIFLIRGNHDPYQKNGEPDPELCSLFSKVCDIHKASFVMKFGRQKVIMCHYAMRTWNSSHHGSWHLYGHSHYSLPDIGNKSMDVGIDAVAGRATGMTFDEISAASAWKMLDPQNYRPLSLDEISSFMENRGTESDDTRHHRPSFKCLQIFEGCITAVEESSFWAELHDLTDKNSGVEVGELQFEEISESDRQFIKDGAIFYWTIGYDATGGRKKRISEIRFKTFPVWTKEMLEESEIEAAELYKKLHADNQRIFS